MITEHILTVIISTLASLWLVHLYFHELGEHRVLQTRAKLFRLRNELFELGRSGTLPFDERAYGMMRLMLNGAIRFAHHATLLHVVSTQAAVRDSVAMRDLTRNHRARWQSALDQLEPNVRAQVLELRRRYFKVMVEHIVLSSPLIVVCLVPVAGVLAGVEWFQRCERKVCEWSDRHVGEALDAIATREGEGLSLAA